MRYIEAVRAQGKSLRTSRAAVTDRLSSLDLAPWRDRRLALVGMGASSNAIASVLGEYWSAGVRAASWLGSELEQAGAAADAEAVVAVSQTGKSAEIYSALSRADCPRLVVTDVESSPIAGLAAATVPLALLEDSEVRTIGYTGTVQALLLLRDALAASGGPAADWDAVADEVERLLPEAERLAERLLPELKGITAFDVVGSGVHAGTAAQGALLLREVCKLPATGYETYQYLHGPIEAAGPGRVLIAIGGAREAKLAASMAAAGATVLLITSSDADAAFRLPALGTAAEAVLGILPLQTITSVLAIESGLPDGEFLYHQDDTKVG
ncbi:MAG TPA: SIS domain-containing protein [Streptosporangiaceae bacterium]|nr:SIS domain-containing protein [Streptosporangiaceae bacterium]